MGEHRRNPMAQAKAAGVAPIRNGQIQVLPDDITPLVCKNCGNTLMIPVFQRGLLSKIHPKNPTGQDAFVDGQAGHVCLVCHSAEATTPEVFKKDLIAQTQVNITKLLELIEIHDNKDDVDELHRSIADLELRCEMGCDAMNTLLGIKKADEPGRVIESLEPTN